MKRKTQTNLSPHLPSFEAVIFDMDGVLVDSESFYKRMEKKLFRQLGLKVSEKEHQTYQGTATDRMWQIIKEKHGLKQPVEELFEMTNALVTSYFNTLEKMDPMPGVEPLIIKLKGKGVHLAVASSSFPDAIDAILKKTGLEKYFDLVVDSRMGIASKPDPGIFLLAAKKMNLLPEKCLVIEDSSNGIKAAKRAGIFCIAFAGPGSEFQDQTEADWIISDFGQLMGLP